MAPTDLLLALQVGHGARHAQHAVVGACGPEHFAHGGAQHFLPGSVGAAVAVDFAWGEKLVGFALSFDLALEGCCDAGGDGDGEFAAGVGLQHVGRHRADFNMHVDAVQQRAGNAILVAQNLVRRALAASRRMPKVAARAGVHCLGFQAENDRFCTYQERALISIGTSNQLLLFGANAQGFVSPAGLRRF